MSRPFQRLFRRKRGHASNRPCPQDDGTNKAYPISVRSGNVNVDMSDGGIDLISGDNASNRPCPQVDGTNEASSISVSSRDVNVDISDGGINLISGDNDQESIEQQKSRVLPLLQNGVVDSIQVMNLLCECDDETIEEIKNRIEKIIIDVCYLSKSNGVNLVSLIRKCVPLKYVSVQNIKLDSSCHRILTECQAKVERFQIGMVTIEDWSLTPEDFSEIALTVKKSNCEQLNLWNCNLTTDKLSALGQRCKYENIKIKTINLWDRHLPPEGFGEFADTLSKSKIVYLKFSRCDLSIDKLSKFGRRCKDDNIMLESLEIEDRSLSPEGFGELAVTAHASNSPQIVLCNCNLSTNKLSAFGKRCKDENIKIANLLVEDRSLTAEGFNELAAAIDKSKCTGLMLRDCNLSTEKLSTFGQRCEDDNIKIQQIVIEDQSLSPEGFSELGVTVEKSKSEILTLMDCELSMEKLAAFGQRCRDQDIKIPEIRMQDQSLTHEGFFELAATFSSSKCETLQLQSCNLSTEKLSKFGKRCEKENVKVGFLIIEDKSLTPEGYSELAATIKKSSCDALKFLSCDLSMEKLSAFGQRCKDENIKVDCLILEGKSLSPEGFDELAATTKKSNCDALKLFGCDLSVEKLSAFGRRCNDENAKIQEITIRDQSLSADGFRELAAAVNQSKCEVLILESCDLSTEKLSEFGKKCQNDNTKIRLLVIEDRFLAPHGFSELAATVHKSDCDELKFRKCDTSADKLSSFGRRCNDDGIKVSY